MSQESNNRTAAATASRNLRKRRGLSRTRPSVGQESAIINEVWKQVEELKNPQAKRPKLDIKEPKPAPRSEPPVVDGFEIDARTGEAVDVVDLKPEFDKDRKWIRVKSVYRPESYCRNLMLSAFGDMFPNPYPYKTLLQVHEVQPLLDKLKKSLARSRVTYVDPEVTCAHLKRIGLGKYYRYRMYLTSRLNPSFKYPELVPKFRRKVIQTYMRFCNKFRALKRRKDPRLKNRSSLPFVGSVLRWILNSMGLVHYGRWLPRMKSATRERAILELISYIQTA